MEMTKRKYGHLTPDSVEAILAIYAEGFTSQLALGRQFGVSRQMIGCVVRGENWPGGKSGLTRRGGEEHRRRFRRAHDDPNYRSDDRRDRRYGMTRAVYEALLKEQHGRCKACGAELLPGRATHVDHCHTTGRTRALLCRSCNLSLGLMKESPERLRKLASYAENHCAQLGLSDDRNWHTVPPR
jgi:hypothetical protein